MKPYYEDGAVTLYHGKAEDILPALALVDVPLYLTDPPYNVSVRNGRANTTIGKVVRGRRGDGTPSYREIRRDFGAWDHDWKPEPFLQAAVPSIRKGGALIAFTSEFLFAPYLASGLEHRSLLYWRKTNPAPNFRKQIVRAIEMAVWQTNGGGWTFNAGGYCPNVFEGPIISGHTVVNTQEARVHPTQKPEWLMNQLVAIFSNPGDLIVDPYVGSGTTAVAAKRLGRKCIAIDEDESYCEGTANRLRQGALDMHGVLA